MNLNMLSDRIYPVKRKSGCFDRVRFADLAATEDPVVGFASPRADLDGGLLQFAIGLLQTVLPLRKKEEWRALWDKPLTPEELQKRLEPWVPHFNLLGEGPAFYQDRDPLSAAEPKPIGSLLMDAPGGSTLKKNTDFFQKRGVYEALCPACTAFALLSLQISAPSGGVGHRTGLRGGGPLVTLFQGETLWETLVLGLQSHGLDRGETPAEDILPWLVPTRESHAKDGNELVPSAPGIHPLQVYWAMPRRIRLENPAAEGVCDLCGQTGQALFQQFRTQNYGNNYASAAWRHPLTPYYKDAKENLLPVHGQSDNQGYREWVGLLVSEEGKRERHPATVVRTRCDELRNKVPKQLLVFGYDMDNMKALNWLWREMPVFPPSGSYEELAALVRALVATAGQIAANTESACKEAMFKRPKDAKGNFAYIRKRFWEQTEPAFYQMLELAASEPQAVKDHWLSTLRTESLATFYHIVDVRLWSTSCPDRVVHARQRLIQFNNNKKLAEQAWPV